MLFDQDSIDTRVSMANARYLYGWEVVRKTIDDGDPLPFNYLDRIYQDWGQAIGQGVEDACNHYVNISTLDEPDNLTWEIL